MMYGNKMEILALALHLLARKAHNNQAQDKYRLEKNIRKAFNIGEGLSLTTVLFKILGSFKI